VTELNGPLAEAATVLTMARAEAIDKFNEYKIAVRVSRSQHDRMMKSVYAALVEGFGLINARAAIVKAGIDSQGFPRLAICRADYPLVFFHRQWTDEGALSVSSKQYLHRRLKGAERERKQFWIKGLDQLPSEKRPRIYYQTVKAVVPIIPPAHRPAGFVLNQYSILWEVDQWEELPRPPRPPGDPMLLKPLGHSDLYAVVAHWDLTEIERMVLGAMLQ
jgi:hypothetical protein